jgi:hypothetical protein
LTPAIVADNFEPEKIDCKPVRVNASSVAFNVSRAGFSVAANSSRKRDNCEPGLFKREPLQLIDYKEIEIISKEGARRYSANTIHDTDQIITYQQCSIFSLPQYISLEK